MNDRSIAQYREASSFYAENWSIIDRELYDLCQKYPDHQRRDVIHAKLLIIGRSYATGIERAIKGGEYQGRAMERLADLFWNRRQQLDGTIQTLRTISEPLTVAKLNDILVAHGIVVNLLHPEVCLTRKPRSFVSKYLHFHCPAVPIYDSVAAREMSRLVPWRRNLEVISPSSAFDQEYWKFSLQFWRLYEELRHSGSKVSVKLADNFVLWQERIPLQ